MLSTTYNIIVITPLSQYPLVLTCFPYSEISSVRRSKKQSALSHGLFCATSYQYKVHCCYLTILIPASVVHIGNRHNWLLFFDVLQVNVCAKLY